MSSIGFIQSMPTVQTNVKNQLVPFGAGPSPLEVGAGVSVVHTRGFITFRLEDLVTNYVWSFTAEGNPANALQLSTVNYILFTANQIGVSSITQVGNVMTVTTPVADSGGRVYTVTFNPSGAQPTTILKSGVNVLTGDAQIRIINNRFVL